MKDLKLDLGLSNNGLTREKVLANFIEMRRQAADVPEMSLDEINTEIAEVRAMRRNVN